MQVFLQIVAFSWQIIGSGRPVLTKGKRPKYRVLLEVVSVAILTFQERTLRVCAPTFHVTITRSENIMFAISGVSCGTITLQLRKMSQIVDTDLSHHNYWNEGKIGSIIRTVLPSVPGTPANPSRPGKPLKGKINQLTSRHIPEFHFNSISTSSGNFEFLNPSNVRKRFRFCFVVQSNFFVVFCDVHILGIVAKKDPGLFFKLHAFQTEPHFQRHQSSS